LLARGDLGRARVEAVPDRDVAVLVDRGARGLQARVVGDGVAALLDGADGVDLGHGPLRRVGQPDVAEGAVLVAASASAARRVGDRGEVVAQPVGVGRGGVVVVVGLGQGGGRVAARLRLGRGRGGGRDARLFLIAAAVI